ncbi:outer membrane lipoprotein carrier protein LolA [Hydrogenophaga borbori]|uniref:Outer membrane lipoprotein carrier protein LolA n=2 Tax=Hydrogenophaga TaxID=47420 RepID=A0A372EN75_9BURK|nr:LolA-related protein [Hydrogenophaga borbori]RFP81123.1 outer membrane lipoprotein carrier protein LolA [Hydrogenophaga borbori]
MLLPLTAARAADELERLMALLAAHPGGTVRFVERRHMAMLDAPLVSRGEMSYRAPDWLERRTLSPRPERLLLDKDTLTLERDQRRMSMPVSQRPEVEAFVASIRSTLQGDRAALERHYRVALQGQPEKRWTLTLEPLQARLRGIVTQIVISGVGVAVDRIDYSQSDGDRTEMRLEPVGKP